MTAREAKLITKKLTIDDVLSMVKTQAVMGWCQATILNPNYDFDLLSQIMSLGYEISKGVNTF